MKLGQISFLSFLSQVLASVVGFVATVAITQIFGAEVFGTYALVVAVVIWLKILATMGIRSAVAKRLSEGEEQGAYVAAGAILLTAALAVLSGLLLLVRGRVTEYVGFDATGWIVALSWAGAALAFVRGVLQGRHRVHYATALKPLDRTVRSLIQIGAVIATVGLAGFLLGYGVGALVAALAGLVLVDVRPTLPEKRHFRELLSFARYSWLTLLSSRTFNSMDTVVLGAFVGTGLIGIYEASWNLASILAVFGTAIAQTMFPEMSQVAADGDRAGVKKLLEQSLTFAGLFLLPGVAGAAIVGDLVLQVYGGEFARGHTVLVLLVFARLVYAYVNQLLTTLNGLDRPDLAFRVNATFVGANVVGNVALVWQFGWIGAAVATVGSAALALVLGYRTTAALLDGLSLPFAEFARQIGAVAAMSAAVLAARQFVDPSLFAGLALALGGAVVYFGVLLGVSATFRTTVRDNIPVG